MKLRLILATSVSQLLTLVAVQAMYCRHRHAHGTGSWRIKGVDIGGCLFNDEDGEALRQLADARRLYGECIGHGCTLTWCERRLQLLSLVITHDRAPSRRDYSCDHT